MEQMRERSIYPYYTEIDIYLIFYAQTTAKGHIRAKQNVFLPQENIVVHYFIHIPPLRIGEMWGKLS